MTLCHLLVHFARQVPHENLHRRSFQLTKKWSYCKCAAFLSIQTWLHYHSRARPTPPLGPCPSALSAVASRGPDRVNAIATYTADQCKHPVVSIRSANTLSVTLSRSRCFIVAFSIVARVSDGICDMITHFVTMCTTLNLFDNQSINQDASVATAAPRAAASRPSPLARPIHVYSFSVFRFTRC